jgi:hypothetical protein
MQRRTLLKFTAALPAIAALPACSGGFDRGLKFTTFDEALAEFARVLSAKKIVSHGADGAAGWSLAKIGQHCAQSIDYAMSGFPQEKSAFFQSTAGTVAFKVFATQGKMSHNTMEPIPGAAALVDDGTPKAAGQAIIQLALSVKAFEAYSGPLKPHFAYGALSKAEFTAANVFHIANHLSKIEVLA